jgi:hypothetical protein
MTETVTLQWSPAHDRARKLVFEPTDDSWQRTEYELHESQWHRVGTERVETVSLTCDWELVQTAFDGGGHDE